MFFIDGTQPRPRPARSLIRRRDRGQDGIQFVQLQNGSGRFGSQTAAAVVPELPLAPGGAGGQVVPRGTGGAQGHLQLIAVHPDGQQAGRQWFGRNVQAHGSQIAHDPLRHPVQTRLLGRVGQRQRRGVPVGSHAHAPFRAFGQPHPVQQAVGRLEIMDGAAIGQGQGLSQSRPVEGQG